MFENGFVAMLNQYPYALSDRKAFIGLIHDLFPMEEMKTNLIISAYDLGIVPEIQKTKEIDKVFVNRFLKELLNKHGISEDNAKWAVTTWCVCYGKKVLRKSGEVIIDPVEPTSGQKATITSITERVIIEDQQLEDLIEIAKNELTVESCDAAIMLAERLEADISTCRVKRISIPTLTYPNTKKITKALFKLRLIAEKKEALYKRIYETDAEIEIIANNPSSKGQWARAIYLCHQQQALLNECESNNWPLPTVRYSAPSETEKQYELYKRMDWVDKTITAKKEKLRTKKQYMEFLQLCSEQQDSIDTCERNAWEIQTLQNRHPDEVARKATEEKKRAEQKRKVIKCGLCILIVFLGLAFLGIWGYKKYEESKIFSKNYKEAVTALQKMGFTNIQSLELTTGWERPYTVLELTVNGKPYDKKADYEPDAEVLVKYSSVDRIDLSSVLRGWKSSKYATVVDELKRQGFFVQTYTETTRNKNENEKIKYIKIEGENYTGGVCAVPMNAKFIITYYRLQITLGEYVSEYKNQKYTDVKNKLKEMGFTNFRFERTDETIIFKGNEGKVVDISIGGKLRPSAVDSFYYDEEVVIRVKTRKGSNYDGIY